MEIKAGNLQEKCLHEAAQIWCKPTTEMIEMDTRLCYEISKHFVDKEVRIEKIEKELEASRLECDALKKLFDIDTALLEMLSNQNIKSLRDHNKKVIMEAVESYGAEFGALSTIADFIEYANNQET